MFVSIFFMILNETSEIFSKYFDKNIIKNIIIISNKKNKKKMKRIWHMNQAYENNWILGCKEILRKTTFLVV